MRRPIFRKGSFANVTSVAALVIALSGTSAYAATLITSKQIKNNTIKSIDVRDGSLTSADLSAGTIPAPYVGTSAYSTFHDAQIAVGSSPTTVLTLDIPSAGSYVANAVTLVSNGGATEASATCILGADSDADAKAVSVEKLAIGSPSRAGYALQVVHTFASAGTVNLVCQALSGTAVVAQNSKITAVKVDHLSNVAG